MINRFRGFLVFRVMGIGTVDDLYATPLSVYLGLSLVLSFSPFPFYFIRS